MPGSNDSIDVSSVVDSGKIGGTAVDTVRPEGGTDHRQIVVLGDPHTINEVDAVHGGSLIVSGGPTSSINFGSGAADVPVVRALTDTVFNVDNIEFGDLSVDAQIATVNASAIAGQSLSALVVSGAMDVQFNEKLTDIKTSVQAIDNAVDGNYLNTNLNIAGTDVAAGVGARNAQTQRVILANDDPGVAYLEIIKSDIKGGLNDVSGGLFNVSSLLNNPGEGSMADLVTSAAMGIVSGLGKPGPLFSGLNYLTSGLKGLHLLTNSGLNAVVSGVKGNTVGIVSAVQGNTVGTVSAIKGNTVGIVSAVQGNTVGVVSALKGIQDRTGKLFNECLPITQSFNHEHWTFSSDIQALSGEGGLDTSSCNPWMGFWFDTIHSPTVRNASCTAEVIADVGNDTGDDSDSGLTLRGSDGGGGDPPGPWVPPIDGVGGRNLQGDQNNPDWGENSTETGGGYNLARASASTRGGSEYALEWHGGAASGTVHDIPPDEWYCQHAVNVGDPANKQATELAFNHNLQPIVAPRKAGGVWVAGKEAVGKTAFIRLDRPHSVNPPLGWINNGCKHWAMGNEFSGTVRMTNDPFDIRPSENTGFGWSWYDVVALPKTVSSTSVSANVSPSGQMWVGTGLSGCAAGTLSNNANGFVGVNGYNFFHANSTYTPRRTPQCYTHTDDDLGGHHSIILSGGYGLPEVSSTQTLPDSMELVKDFSSCWAVLSSTTNLSHETVVLPDGTSVATPALEPNTEYLITAEVSCVHAGATFQGQDYSGALFVWGGTNAAQNAACYPTDAGGDATKLAAMGGKGTRDLLNQFHSLHSPYVLAKTRNINPKVFSDTITNAWGDYQDLGTVSSTFKTDASSTNLVIGWRGMMDISQGICNSYNDVWAIRNISIYKKHYNTCKRLVLHGISMDSAGNTAMKADMNGEKPGMPKGTMTIYDGKYPTNHGWDPHWAGWAGVAFSGNPSGPPASSMQSYGALNNSQHESNVHAEYRHQGDIMGMSRQTIFDPPVPCHPGYPIRTMCTEEWQSSFTPFVDLFAAGGTTTQLNHGVRPSDVFWNGTINYSIETMKDSVAPVMSTDARNPNQSETPNTDKCT